jgi:hypothetical protein
MGVELHELDSTGAYLQQLANLQQNAEFATSSLSVFGARHHVLKAHFVRWDASPEGGATINIVSDAVTHDYYGAASGLYALSVDVTGDAAGDLFIRSNEWNGSDLQRFGAPSWAIYTGAPLSPLLGPHPSWITNVIAGNDGNLYIVGSGEAYDYYFSCERTTSPGTYLAKLDPSGKCIFSHRLPLALVNAGSAVLPNAGTLYIIDEFQGTADVGCGPVSSGDGASTLLSKLDATGTCLWSRSVPVSTVGGVRASLFPSGDLLLSTLFEGTLDLGGGPLTSAGIQDLAIARFDTATGAHVWSERAGGPGSLISWSRVTADATGRVVVSGTFSGTVDFGGGPLSGSKTSFAVKLDPGGALVWQRILPDGSVAAPDPCGAVIVAVPCNTCAPNNTPGVSVSKLAP